MECAGTAQCVLCVALRNGSDVVCDVCGSLARLDTIRSATVLFQELKSSSDSSPVELPNSSSSILLIDLRDPLSIPIHVS